MKSTLLTKDFTMRTFISRAGRPAYYTLSEAAWVLGVEPAVVARAVRVGTLRARWRRGRFVVPATELARVLGNPIAGEDTHAGDAP
jgi:hypothetical protein